MKNHRRRLSFVAVAMALALMLGACGGQTASSSSQQSDAQSTSPSAPSQEASEESGSQEESSVAEVTPVFGETFTSEDLEGNAVDQTIFEGHDLTMVNIWATFCGPCLDEMPDLGELNTQYADQNFQIVGIVVDVLNQDLTYNEEQVALAKEVVEKTGRLLYPPSSVYGSADEQADLCYRCSGDGFCGQRGQSGGRILSGCPQQGRMVRDH